MVDNFTRESLAIAVDRSIRGEQVVEVLQSLVMLDFSRPGKPTDNAYVESFNGRLREECLNTHWFLSMEDARDKTDGVARI